MRKSFVLLTLDLVAVVTSAAAGYFIGLGKGLKRGGASSNEDFLPYETLRKVNADIEEIEVDLDAFATSMEADVLQYIGLTSDYRNEPNAIRVISLEEYTTPEGHASAYEKITVYFDAEIDELFLDEEGTEEVDSNIEECLGVEWRLIFEHSNEFETSVYVRNELLGHDYEILRVTT